MKVGSFLEFWRVNDTFIDIIGCKKATEKLEETETIDSLICGNRKYGSDGTNDA